MNKENVKKYEQNYQRLENMIDCVFIIALTAVITACVALYRTLYP